MTEEFVDLGYASDLSHIIKVIGVGGGGGNALKHMLHRGITDVDFIICNTDEQALKTSDVPVKIQLGENITEGRGAGNMPERGRQAAEESRKAIEEVLKSNTKMLFITAGMGGGTGTGAAPAIAEFAAQFDILTIAVLTIPSRAEGRKRYNQAVEGVKEIYQYVDSLLVIDNQKIQRMYGDLPASKAFGKADEILTTAVKGVAEIITLHGNINIDFADVATVMKDSGVFIMGTGVAVGENRALTATKAALESPLLDNNDIKGTQNILLNITSGEEEVTIGEIGDIIDFLQDHVGSDANIIWGNGHDASLGNQVCVTILATGFDADPTRITDPGLKNRRKGAEPIHEPKKQSPKHENIEEEQTTQKVVFIDDDDIEEEQPKKTKKTAPKEQDDKTIKKVNKWIQTKIGNLFDDEIV